MINITNLLNFIKWQLQARGTYGSITERILCGSLYKDILTNDDCLYYVYWNDIHRSAFMKFLLGTFKTTNDDYREFIEFLNRNYANGRFYDIKSFDGRTIRILIPDERDYKCFKAEFLDIIMPSMLDQNVSQPFLEGPYEYGNVQIEKGDNVLDLGANFGLFSSLASSKGAKVYAFEVTPRILGDYLYPLAIEDNNIKVMPYAVSDKTGDAYFNLNEGTPSCNHLVDDASVNSLKVPTTSVDDFVARMHLDHLDFIKADIEGAERLMLSGAKDTLREFAPKLAICYYHMLDDERVLTDLILSANPDYEITKAYKKVYARTRKK